MRRTLYNSLTDDVRGAGGQTVSQSLQLCHVGLKADWTSKIFLLYNIKYYLILTDTSKQKGQTKVETRLESKVFSLQNISP